LDETKENFVKFLDGNFKELPENTDQFIALAANTVTSFIGGGGEITQGRGSGLVFCLFQVKEEGQVLFFAFSTTVWPGGWSSGAKGTIQDLTLQL